MNQLPTYILFDNATGIARLPGLDFEAKNYHPSITKVNQVKYRNPNGTHYAFSKTDFVRAAEAYFKIF